MSKYFPYNKELRPCAQSLRKAMTPEEKHLWYDFLQRLPTNVYRQRTVLNYILDFYVPTKRLAIELDGSQHGLEENHMKDCERDENLRKIGVTVLRYSNEAIHTNFRGVCIDILRNLGFQESDVLPPKK